MKRGRGGAEKALNFCLLTPHPVLNDQSLVLPNFEGLVLLSPSEIKRELCKLMSSISQGMDRYKVPVVGKNGKLNETIEWSALWSILQFRAVGARKYPNLPYSMNSKNIVICQFVYGIGNM